MTAPTEHPLGTSGHLFHPLLPAGGPFTCLELEAWVFEEGCGLGAHLGLGPG